jgi:hypothetical protein
MIRASPKMGHKWDKWDRFDPAAQTETEARS